MGPHGALGAEAAAGEGALDVDAFEGKAEGAGEGHLVADDVLGGVVDGELVAVPPGGGGVGLHWVVVLDGGGVGYFDLFGGLGERGGDVSAFGFVGLPLRGCAGFD